MLGLAMRRSPYCGIIPTGISRLPDDPMLRWTRLVRPQDFIWVLLFSVLIYTLPFKDRYDSGPLVGLAVLQILEPKIPALASTRGRVLWIVLQVILDRKSTRLNSS